MARNAVAAQNAADMEAMEVQFPDLGIQDDDVPDRQYKVTNFVRDYMNTDDARSEIESIASSAESMALEEARAEVKRLKTDAYAQKLREEAMAKELALAAKTKAKEVAKMNPNEIKHDAIVADPVFVNAIEIIETLDDCNLWWVVQWVNEYLARFKASASRDQWDAHDSYKNWTQTTKQKHSAGLLQA